MATIIETANGFIAGDPPETLPEGHHWCDYCAGSGLDCDFDGEPCICGACSGLCTRECDDPDCADHHMQHKIIDRSAWVAAIKERADREAREKGFKDRTDELRNEYRDWQESVGIEDLSDCDRYNMA